MMKKFILVLIMVTICFTASAIEATEAFKIGFVNFKECVENSKQGQQEKEAFEKLKNNMAEALQKTDKELTEIARKLEDQDYMDGLSPTAETELKGKFQALSQEFQLHQSQYYQLLNQANYKMLQTLHDQVSAAAEKIRTQHDLALILNEESTFAFSDSLDFTAQVIDEMNREFQTETSDIANLD